MIAISSADFSHKATQALSFFFLVEANAGEHRPAHMVRVYFFCAIGELYLLCLAIKAEVAANELKFGVRHVAANEVFARKNKLLAHCERAAFTSHARLLEQGVTDALFVGSCLLGLVAAPAAAEPSRAMQTMALAARAV